MDKLLERVIRFLKIYIDSKAHQSIVETMSVPIITTKLYIPTLQDNLVQRPHLVERLEQAALHGLLKKFRDLGITIISINRIKANRR